MPRREATNGHRRRPRPDGEILCTTPEGGEQVAQDGRDLRHVVLPRSPHRPASDPMGAAQIQASEASSPASLGMVACCSQARAAPIRYSLGACFSHLTSTCGSRMTGDCHVRFCESRGVRFPPATQPVRQIGGASGPPTRAGVLQTNLPTCPSRCNHRPSRLCPGTNTVATLHGHPKG